MKQFKALFSAQYKSTFREKQVWFWSIFYPVMLLVVFLLIFGKFGGDGAFEAKVAVVSAQPNAVSESLLGTLRQVPALVWKEKEPVSRETAERWVKDKEVDAAIVLPAQMDGREVELILNKEKESSTLGQAVGGILNWALTASNFQLAHVNPQLSLQTNYVSSGSEKLKYTDFLLTGLIALSIAQAGLFGMVAMVEMRKNGLLKRLMLTPMRMKWFGLSGMAVRFILSAIQVILLTLIGVLFFHASVHFNLLSFLLMFVVGTISFTAVGFFVAAFSKSMESYFGMANLISFIMMFLSGIFFDSSMLPSFIKPIAQVLPLTYFANGIRDGMVYGYGIANSAFWLNIGVLTAWGLVGFVVGSRFYKWKA